MKRGVGGGEREGGQRGKEDPDLLPGDPICTSRYQLDGVVDRPEQPLDVTPATPAFLVSENHRLQSRSRKAQGKKERRRRKVKLMAGIRKGKKRRRGLFGNPQIRSFRYKFVGGVIACSFSSFFILPFLTPLTANRNYIYIYIQ